MTQADFPCVFKDSAEKNPERRYKMLIYLRRSSMTPDDGRNIYASYSPDGICWSDPLKDGSFPHNPLDLYTGDAQSFMFDKKEKRYVGLTRSYVLEEMGGRPVLKRTRTASISDDLVQWTEPVLILRNDEKDPANVELYHLEVSVYENLYIGLLGVFHTDPPLGEKAPGSPFLHAMRGKIDVQLAVSRDGIDWERVGNREVFIPNGPAGSFDSHVIFCPTDPLIPRGDEIWIYYSGSDLDHVERGTRYCVGRAILRLDGFVSIDGGEDEGTVTTKPLRFTGTRLTVNAKVEEGGHLAVEILDSENHPIDGFGEKDCDFMTTDEVRHVMTWNGSPYVSPPIVRPKTPEEELAWQPPMKVLARTPWHFGTPIKLKFHLKKARLYSFVFNE
jgi:hypothetical protein